MGEKGRRGGEREGNKETKLGWGVEMGACQYNRLLTQVHSYNSIMDISCVEVTDILKRIGMTEDELRYVKIKGRLKISP